MRETKNNIIFFPFDKNDEYFLSNSAFELIFRHFIKQGYIVKLDQDSFDSEEVHFTIVLRKLNKSEIVKLLKVEYNFLIIFEPRVVDNEIYAKNYHSNFSKIFTFDDDLVLSNKRYKKFSYPNDDKRILFNDVSYQEKKLLTMISSNKCSKSQGELYSARKEIIQTFELFSKEFDFYGRGWNRKYISCYSDRYLIKIIKKALQIIFKTRFIKQINYCGEIKNKLEVLSNYRFSICYENSNAQKGYITEKIFDCFFACVVPVYLGAANITDYIPSNCFIDARKFVSNIQLREYLLNMSEIDFNKYLYNINAFLKSAKFRLFTNEYFANNIITEILKSIKQ